MSSFVKVLRPVVQNQTNFVSAFSPKIRESISFPENSRFTKQSFKDECDINVLMAKYMSTGEMPRVNERMPQYLDVTGADFQSAMEKVAEAQTLFNEMPSAIRNRFANDPARFLDFCSNPANEQEMRELGLLGERPVVVAPAPVVTEQESTPVA